MAAHTYLERYLAGEYERVWDELVGLGAAALSQPLSSDAYAVARETMRRVRYNIDLLIPRLQAAGYQFGYGWSDSPDFPSGPPDPVFSPPALDVTATLAKLEARAGVLPLSLRAFYEVVGSVNFVGAAPADWPDWRAAPDGLDALYVYPIAGTLEDMYRWEDAFGDLTAEEWSLPDPGEDDLCDTRAYAALPRDCWLAPIAPDAWHKYDISGCGGYEIAIPSMTADARLLTERHRTTFVNYLRICLRWAGFPGLEPIASAHQKISGLATLADGLLPF